METLVALTILGMAGIAVLSGVQTSQSSKKVFDIHSTVENIIRNQVEYVFEQEYIHPLGEYLTITAPNGFDVTAEALESDGDLDNMSIVRITVYHDGQEAKVFEVVRTDR